MPERPGVTGERPSQRAANMPSAASIVAPMRVMLYECSQRSLRWGLLLPTDASAPNWQGVEVSALSVHACESDGVAALRRLEIALDRSGNRRLASIVVRAD
jgi:hypothetical protein